MTEYEDEVNLLERIPEMFGRFMLITRGRAAEVRDTIGQIRAIDSWCPQFSNLAQKYEEQAEKAETGEAKSEAYLLAAGYYHIAQMLLLRDTEEKKKVYNFVVSNYTKAMKYFKNPTQRVEIPFEGSSLPGYFRKRPDIERAPGVLIIGGADSSKEIELHLHSEGFLERGLFTFTFDGPGQGESRFKGIWMRHDFEKPVSAALDYLQNRLDIDVERIGVFGVSFGGHLGPRAAALDSRLKACISLGGFYNLAEFEWPPQMRPRIENIMGIQGIDNWYRERKQYNLDAVIDKLECHLLVMNGSEDATIPVSQSIKIHENANCPKELRIYEGAEHCASSVPESRIYLMDWMIDKLK